MFFAAWDCRSSIQAKKVRVFRCLGLPNVDPIKKCDCFSLLWAARRRSSQKLYVYLAPRLLRACSLLHLVQRCQRTRRRSRHKGYTVFSLFGAARRRSKQKGTCFCRRLGAARRRSGQKRYVWFFTAWGCQTSIQSKKYMLSSLFGAAWPFHL